jgi:hypothetical protein
MAMSDINPIFREFALAFIGRVKGQGAIFCPDGLGNPFLHLRLGQVQFELKNIDGAKDNLARAYMGGGDEILADDDPKYWRFIREILQPPNEELIHPEHPRDELAFFFQRPSHEAAAQLTALLAKTTSKRWTLGTPTLIDETEGACRNLGGVVGVYCGHPPWGERLPREVDAIHLSDVRHLIADLEMLSTEAGPIAVWFDGEEMGDIRDGQADEAIRRGLLEEWRRRLEQRHTDG